MIPCKLVHDTGTMVRFRTSQLPLLPCIAGFIIAIGYSLATRCSLCAKK